MDDHHIEIRPATGFAWVEIDQIDATHPGPMGSAYNPHADVAASEQTLLSALREDGSYGDPVILSTRGGLPVWTVTGHNDPFDDDVVIGLQVLGDHALLVIGHQGDTPDDWESLKQMYLLMLQSLGDTGAP